MSPRGHAGVGALIVVLLVSLSPPSARAQQGSQTTVEIGVGGNIVVGAWNPVRLVTRDVPAGTRLLLTLDQGSLRQGLVPLEVELAVAGGAGISVVDSLVYVSSYHSISWALRGPESVLASGSLTGRDQDTRPLDLVLSREPGRYLSAFGTGTRVIDVAAAALPIEVAAYDGVRTLIVDGTTTAPRLEAVAAAAAAGAIVVLHGDLPPSHRELRLLVAGSGPGAALTRTPLGAGAVLTTRGAPSDAVAAALSYPVVDRAALIAALATRPLVERPAGPSQPLVLIAAGLFSLVALAMLRWFGAPGIVGAAALALLLSFVAWRAFRPAQAQLTGVARLALVGGELATTTELREVLTLPAAVIDAPRTARPLLPQPYSLDATGTHYFVARWRAVTVVMTPVVAAPALQLRGTELVNSGTAVLREVTVVGLGPQGDIAPGRAVAVAATEDGPLSAIYAGLFPHLLPGTVVALSNCDSGCTVWVAPSLFEELVGPL